MAATIKIGNVPDTLHRRLKARAALAGMSLSDYLLNEIRRMAVYPSVHELRTRLASRSKTTLRVTPARAIRDERDRR